MSLEQEMTRRRLLRGAGLLALVGIAAPVTTRLAIAQDSGSGTDGADSTGEDGNGGNGTGGDSTGGGGASGGADGGD